MTKQSYKIELLTTKKKKKAKAFMAVSFLTNFAIKKKNNKLLLFFIQMVFVAQKFCYVNLQQDSVIYFRQTFWKTGVDVVLISGHLVKHLSK